MRRPLLRSAAFVRALTRTLKKDPRLAQDIQQTLEMLTGDAFHLPLKTHKLKGPLEGCWACSAGYDLRIVFRFVQYEGADAILLETLGTHEEVY